MKYLLLALALFLCLNMNSFATPSEESRQDPEAKTPKENFLCAKETCFSDEATQPSAQSGNDSLQLTDGKAAGAAEAGLNATTTALSAATIAAAVAAINREDTGTATVRQFAHQAAARGCRLLVLPFGFPALSENETDVGGTPANAAAFLSSLAAETGIYIVGGYHSDGMKQASVFAPDGSVCGSYRQTHRLPGESFTQGDLLAPVKTPLGMIGLSIGSDIYFPEVHWSLAQQGADILIHLDGIPSSSDHFYSVLSPQVRAFDCHRPFLLARPTSTLIKLVHNEAFGIAGTPMSGSCVFDPNGAQLASTGFSQGLALADLRFEQRSISPESAANLLLQKGTDVWKLYFNDSRARYFAPLRRPYDPPARPAYLKRKIRIAIVSNSHDVQLGHPELLRLTTLACQSQPDIVVLTEMEKGSRPDDPAVAAALAELIAQTSAAGSYLLVGGVRLPEGAPAAQRTSHGVLWDRSGKPVFQSRIMLYGKGCGQDTFETDFGRIGIRLCGDVYAPELDRLFAMQGVDIVFNPSMSWGASGLINTMLSQARAMDNGHFVVNAHLALSDQGLRSNIIDPTGYVVAASPYEESSVLIVDIDLDARRGVFVRDTAAAPRSVAPDAYLAPYRSAATHRLLPPEELFRLRRPELYVMLDADRSDHPYTTRDRGDGCLIARPPEPLPLTPL